MNRHRLHLIGIALAAIVLVAGCVGSPGSSPLQISPLVLPEGTVQQLYTARATAQGGQVPLSWSVASGQLPPGVFLAADTGTISGSPTSAGKFGFQLQVTDSQIPHSRAVSPNLVINVQGRFSSLLAITTTSLPSGTAQTAYNVTLGATGGTTPYRWSVLSGSLPPGISLGSSSGTLAGTPSGSGQFSFTVQVQDSSAVTQTAKQGLTLNVGSSSSPSTSALHISSSSVPAGAVQVAYSDALSASGGTPPYSWSVVGGTFPPGLSLSSSGAISGTPSQAGTFVFTAQVKDSAGQTASSSFSANIAPPASPVINGLSPNSGPVSGGTEVTISGSNFASGATVSFGGVAGSSVVVASATQISVVSPAHIAGSVEVTVNENGQTSSGASFTYSAVSPTVAGVFPNSGPTAGGTTVTISGTNFLSGASVLFGTVSSPSVSVSSGSKILAVTPPNSAGAADVTVQDPGNLAAKLSAAFTYNSPSSGPPTIASVSPTSGPAGTEVTITGTNFESVSKVALGSTSASSVTFVSPTELEAAMPSVSTGTYGLTVTNPDPISATLNNAFTVTSSSPVSAQSLLAGCTVNANNTPSCAIPSGWNLRDAEGFEGSVPEITLGNIDPSLSHSGSKSLSVECAGSQCATALFYPVGAVNDVYISQWRYYSAGATQGADHYLYRLYLSNGSQECIVDPQDNNPNYITLTSPNVMVCQGYGAGVEAADWPNAKGWTIAPGVWVQYELWFHGNTTCSGTQLGGTALPAGDGFYRFYVNGQLQMSGSNVNLTNCNSFHQNPLLHAEAVFLLSAVWYEDASGGCLPNDAPVSAVNFPQAFSFSSAPKFQVDGVSPCWGSEPPFKVALDDIIIMSK